MASLGNFNATEHEPQQTYDLLPPGDYQAMIVKSEMKETKAGGTRLALELVILDGPAKDRRLWDGLNLVNSNQTAVDIANRTLSSICHATGQLGAKDSEELHNIPMMVKVAIKAAQGQYSAGNEVKGYSALRSAGAPRVAAASQAQAPARSSPPWRKAG